VSSLNRKLLRDLWGVRGQAAAIAAVMACGMAIYVMAMSASDSLLYSQTAYYDRYRFGDVFANVKRAPLSVHHHLANVPGVLSADLRIVRDVTLSLEGLREPATARLISAPERPGEGLNTIHLRMGRYLEPQDVNNVLVNESFAKAWNIKPGDHVTVIMNGRLRRLQIVGVALSPEYVYLIRPGDLIPDPKRFGIFWMNRKAMEAAFDMEGAFNDISLQLMPNANLAEVIRRTDSITATYGGLGGYGRHDQMSNRFLSDEITSRRWGHLFRRSFYACRRSC
jgi:putative ABC transport system permease protein